MANPTADYPTAVHTATDVSAFGSSKLGSTTPTHTNLEGKQEEEIAALQTKVGIGSSAPATDGHVLTVQADGSTAWEALPAAAAGDMKADGTVPFTAKVSYDATKTFSSDLELVSKDYVDGAITGAGGYTDEAAQDAVGAIVADTDTIDFTYTDATPALTADVKDGSITLAKQANLAANTIIGRATASTGVPEAMTATQVRTMINVADGANAYVHPNHSGDVTSAADGATTIANNAVTTTKIADSNVTLAKIANIATARLLGRTTASAGVVEELTSADSFVTDASTTAKGKVELAIASEVNTGTSETLAVTPDALAGSNLGIRYLSFNLNGTTALTTDAKGYQRIPAAYNGMNLVSVTGSVGTGAAGSSSSGTPTFTVKNVTDNQQMLSTSLTIDASEYSSATAAAAAVINTSYDDVATDDLIEVACTVAGTGTTYATITLGFQTP
jgi:hypothetical protein